MRFFLVCVVFIFGILVVSSPIRASDIKLEGSESGQINEALLKTTPIRFLPPNPLYYFVRIKELGQRFLTSSAKDRAKFDFVISSKRLKETYLLLGRNDIERVTTSLNSYANTLRGAKKQLEKATLQNQDIRPDVDEMAIGLGYQEIILGSIVGKIDGALENKTLDSFSDFVNYLEKFKPGISTRYKITRQDKILEETLQPSPPPSPVLRFETTSSANPRRFIY